MLKPKGKCEVHVEDEGVNFVLVFHKMSVVLFLRRAVCSAALGKRIPVYPEKLLSEKI